MSSSNKKNTSAPNQNKESRLHKFLNGNRVMRILYWVVLISFLVPVVFLIIRMIVGGVSSDEAGYHSNADYALMILQCLLGAVVINVPAFLSKRLKFEIPVVLYAMYIIFLYCAIFLGEVRSFYYTVPNWDSILHSFSALMLGSFGFMLVAILNRNEKLMVQLSPFFISAFAFCFALAAGAMWEIYEFTFDGLLGLNMQKFMTSDGIELIGRAALSDTMKDIILDAAGSLVAAIVGYFSIKNDKLWLMPKLTKSDDDDQKETGSQSDII